MAEYNITVTEGTVEQVTIVVSEGANFGTGGTGNGTPGADGADGLSAYEIAVSEGFVGTESAWLASLEGEAGPQGPAGPQGVPGADGAAGASGADGLSAYEIAVADGFVGNEAAWLASLQGADGADGAAGSTILAMTETEYLALETVDPATLYILTDVPRIMYGALAVANLSTGSVAAPATIRYMMAGAPTEDGLRVAVVTTEETTGLRIAYSTDPALAGALYSNPLDTTNAARIAQFSLTGLAPKTRVYYQAFSQSQAAGPIQSALTSGGVGDAVKFAFASCALDTNSPTWGHIAGRTPDFFISLGDTPYMDYGGTDPQVLRDLLQTFYSQTYTLELLSAMPWLYIWDDHDFGPDNSGASSPATPAVQQVYRELQPSFPLVDANAVYHAYTIGAVRFICMDLRSERVSGSLLDPAQMTWVKGELTAAAADANIGFVVLQSTVAWISSSNSDTWFGFQAERLEIGDHILDVGLENRMCIIGGDAHMIAYDDGTNNVFNTLGVASFPVFMSAPINHPNPSVKGGPYTGGTFTASDSQFSVMEITQDGLGEFDVVVKGYADNVEIYTFTFKTAAGLYMPAAPTEITLSSNEVPASSDAGAVVGSLTANQPGAVFAIVSDPSGNFEISGTDLVVAAGATLTESDVHAVTISATNGQGAFNEAFNITVTAAVVVGSFGQVVQIVEDKNFSFSQDFSATLPSAPVSGNLLVFTVAVDKATPGITVPAGFTLLDSHPGTNNEISFMAAYKVSDGTETGPITSTWATTSRRAAVNLVEIEGPFTALPLSLTSVKTEAQANTVTLTPPAVVNVPSVALAYYMNDSASSVGAAGVATANGGYTVYPVYSPIGGESQPILIFAHKILTSGETPTVTVGHTGGNDGSVGYLAIFN